MHPGVDTDWFVKRHTFDEKEESTAPQFAADAFAARISTGHDCERLPHRLCDDIAKALSSAFFLGVDQNSSTCVSFEGCGLSEEFFAVGFNAARCCTVPASMLPAVAQYLFNAARSCIIAKTGHSVSKRSVLRFCCTHARHAESGLTFFKKAVEWLGLGFCRDRHYPVLRILHRQFPAARQARLHKCTSNKSHKHMTMNLINFAKSSK
jgi:hypothetical protein